MTAIFLGIRRTSYRSDGGGRAETQVHRAARGSLEDGGGDADPVAGGSVCIANIGPRERRRRLFGGVIGLGIGFAAAAALIVAGISPWWRLALVIPFAMGTIGVFQAREKT